VAENSLEILIKIATEGGPQAQAVIAQLNKAAAEGSKDAAAALQTISAAQKKTATAAGELSSAVKEVASATAGQTTEVKKAAETFEEEAKATVKSADAKKHLHEAAHGLTRQFPVLGQAVRLLANPIGAVIALLALLVTATRSYLDEVAQMEAASLAFDTAAQRVGNLASQHRILRAENADFATRYKDAAAAINNVSTALQGLLEMTALQQRQEQRLDDEQAKKQLATLRADKSLTPEQRIEQEFQINEAALQRRNAREVVASEKKEGQLRLMARVAGAGEENATFQSKQVDAALPDARLRAAVDAERLKPMQEGGASALEKLQKERGIVNRYAEGKQGSLDTLSLDWMKVTGNTLPGGTSIEFGPRTQQENAQKRLEELDSAIEKQVAANLIAAEVARNSAHAADELGKRKAHYEAEILKFQQEAAALLQQANQERKKITLTSATEPAIQAARVESATIEKNSSAAEARRQTFDKTRSFLKDFMDVDIGAGGFGPDSKSLPLPAGGNIFPGPRGGTGAVDTAPLRDVSGSTGELAEAIKSFAERSVSLHGATASSLSRLGEALGNLEARFNDSRIA